MDARASLERLCKWRTILAGWQLGTRAKGDPECDAVRDHREVTLLLRVEVNALVQLLIKKGVITAAEFGEQSGIEAEHLMRAYERQFPGAKATDDGMMLDTAQVQGWLKGFRP